MNYVQTTAPYLRRKKTTLQIMIDLAIGLGIIWVLAIVMSFLKLGNGYGLNSIFLMLTSIGVTLVCDVITTVLKNKKDKELGKKIVYDLIHNYSWITAMIFTLCCPVWTPYYVIIIGSIFATVIGKNVFGGFGKNIFNPAAAGRLFVLLCFSIPTPEGIKGIDATTGATITTAINSKLNWLGSNAIPGFGIKELLFGTYFGAMGEVFTLAMLLVGIFLVVREVINWRIPAFYLGTITLSALMISLVCGFNDPMLYVTYHLCAGGAMFAAIFMLTDPVTTPTSPLGNCLVGILAGVMTVLIRVGTNNPEGVVYSIMVVNTFSPMMDHFITKKTNKNTLVKSAVTFGSVVASIALCAGVSYSKNGGREVYFVNGFKVEEYYEYIEPLNLRNINAKGYTIAKTEAFEDEGLYAPTYYKLSDGTLVNKVPEAEYEEVQYDKEYLVKNGKKDIGVMYCVKVEQGVEADGYPIKGNDYCIAYVAIEFNTNAILEISLYQVVQSTGTNSEGECFGDAYTEMVEKVVNNLEYDNLTPEAFDEIECNATYSFDGVKKAVKKAYEIYAKEGR